MKPLGILAELDQAALALCCALVAQFQEQQGSFPTSRLAQLRALMDSLGLTPAGRQRLTPDPQQQGPGDGWDQFQ
jgi:hypothetical protein